MRIFALLILLFMHLLAFSKDDIIDEILFSRDNKIYINVNEFDEDKYLNKFFLKIKINKEVLKKETFYLRILHNFNGLKSINVDSKKEDNQALITLDSKTPEDIILEFRDGCNLSLDLTLHTESEFENLERNEYLFYGFSYGIIFCAFLYNFVLFLYNRSRTFLYYSCFQISLLLMLLLSTMTPDILKPLFIYFPLDNILGQISLIFAILFNKSFLDLKTTIPKFDKFLSFLVYAYIIDIFILIFSKVSFIEEYIPISSLLFLLLLSSFLVYKQGYKIAIFYILAWGVIFISVLVVEFGLFNYPDIYALHFGLPLESLILSFTLGYKMREFEKQKIIHEKMLIHQSKLASMGEMINNIAHQYRQPLTHLGYILMNIKSAHEHNDLDDKYLKSKIDTANKQLQFMSDTIDNFRDFYKPNKIKEKFYIYIAVANAIDILNPLFNEKNIQISMDIDTSIKINGYENEYSQVVLNLLSNAKDSLLFSKVLNPQIKVELKVEKNVTKLYIEDNGIGVSNKIKEKIFEPYFSTKSKSSGIGLYMSNIIIREHFKGELYLDKSTNGASFIIEV